MAWATGSLPEAVQIPVRPSAARFRDKGSGNCIQELLSVRKEVLEVLTQITAPKDFVPRSAPYDGRSGLQSC